MYSVHCTSVRGPLFFVFEQIDTVHQRIGALKKERQNAIFYRKSPSACINCRVLSKETGPVSTVNVQCKLEGFISVDLKAVHILTCLLVRPLSGSCTCSCACVRVRVHFHVCV
jgi:hypothetical protein